MALRPGDMEQHDPATDGVGGTVTTLLPGSTDGRPPGAQQAHGDGILRSHVQPVTPSRGSRVVCRRHLHTTQPDGRGREGCVRRLLRAHGPRVPGKAGGVQEGHRRRGLRGAALLSAMAGRSRLGGDRHLPAGCRRQGGGALGCAAAGTGDIRQRQHHVLTSDGGTPMTVMRLVAFWAGLALLLAVSVLGVSSALGSLDSITTTGQEVATVTQFGYALTGVLAAGALLAGRPWASAVLWLWAVFLTVTAGLAP